MGASARRPYTEFNVDRGATGGFPPIPRTDNACLLLFFEKRLGGWRGLRDDPLTDGVQDQLGEAVQVEFIL